MLRATLLAVLLATPAAAEGFRTRDLTTLDTETAPLPGGRFVRKAEPDRLTLLCIECAEITTVDIHVLRSTDGTEDRIRAGATTAEMMFALCKARDSPSALCQGIERRDAGGAVGFLSRVALDASALETQTLYEDGDLLVIRAIAPDPATAAALGAAALATLVPQIVD